VSRLSLVRAAAVAVALAIPVAALVSPSPAYACSCANVATGQSLRNADAVFRGRVTAKDRVGRGEDARTDLRFAVDSVYKGAVYRDQVVASPRDRAGCGLDPAVGTTWIIFAIVNIQGSGNDAVERLVTSSCSGDLPTTNAPALLGRALAPLDGASDRLERSTRADRRLTRGLTVTGIGLAGVLALTGVGLSLIWRRRSD
jgi:hypothetical protein